MYYSKFESDACISIFKAFFIVQGVEQTTEKAAMNWRWVKNVLMVQFFDVVIGHTRFQLSKKTMLTF